ncbi:MAG: glycosyltransferase [Chloroflexi bacterium]|nr:glycosyltransferase [Chloroflexota bacterium]
MRILLTSESYLPYLSGVTVAVDALARGLGARGHQVMVLAPRPSPGTVVKDVGTPGPEPSYAWLASYQLPRVAPPGYRMPLPNPADPALGQARRFAPDIVHAHSPFVTGVMARRLAGAAGRPLAFTHHTRFDDYSHYLGPLGRAGSLLGGAFLRRFWLASSAIIAPSTELAEEIRERLPRHARRRVVVVPTGVDVAGIQSRRPIDIRPVAGWAPDTLVVASLGRLAPEKSPGTILDAFALAARTRRELRLLLIGGGPMKAELRERAESPTLVGRVHLTGEVPRPEALAMLAGADLFVFASQTETQGLVLAEALSAGLPAVAIDAPGVRDSVRDRVDGRILPADPRETRAERLAAALEEVARDDGVRRSMAARARADAPGFALDRRVEQVESVYRAIAR